MKLEAPQIIFCCMMLISVGVALARYGQPKRDTYDIVDLLIGPALTCSLLWWGGFFG